MVDTRKGKVYGVGINDANYVVRICENIGYVDGKWKQKQVWTCPFFQTWKNMLKRSYSEKSKVKRPTYLGCSVCEDWHLFSNFKAWMEVQDWKGRQLDKDLLVRGNKLYSPDTCVFVDGIVNSFMLDCASSRGKYMIGVSWYKRDCRFTAQCSNPFTGKGEYLGYFDSELDAHNAWLKRKLELAIMLASMQTDKRVSKALIDAYKNYDNKESTQ